MQFRLSFLYKLAHYFCAHSPALQLLPALWAVCSSLISWTLISPGLLRHQLGTFFYFIFLQTGQERLEKNGRERRDGSVNDPGKEVTHMDALAIHTITPPPCFWMSSLPIATAKTFSELRHSYCKKHTLPFKGYNGYNGFIEIAPNVGLLNCYLNKIELFRLLHFPLTRKPNICHFLDFIVKAVSPGNLCASGANRHSKNNVMGCKTVKSNMCSLPKCQIFSF